jgi:hypothetical protein
LSSLEVSLKDTLRTLLEDTQISVGQWRTTGGTSLDDTLEDTLEDIPEDTPEEVSSGFHGGRWENPEDTLDEATGGYHGEQPGVEDT